VPDLSFRILDAAPVPHSATPHVSLSIEAACADPACQIESVLLRCTVRIEASARAHDSAERERLRDLFGGPEVWERSNKSLLWTDTTAFVPGFRDHVAIDVLLPVGHDLEHAASRYVTALAGGEVPIAVHFRGTVFHRTDKGLEVGQIPWDREARFRMPVAELRAALERHFANARVVPLRRDVFDRLDRYRADHGLATWELAVERLLGSTPEERA
jgi:hypothetical protein